MVFLDIYEGRKFMVTKLLGICGSGCLLNINDVQLHAMNKTNLLIEMFGPNKPVGASISVVVHPLPFLCRLSVLLSSGSLEQSQVPSYLTNARKIMHRVTDKHPQQSAQTP